jgi:hypothetical protein
VRGARRVHEREEDCGEHDGPLPQAVVVFVLKR